MDFGAKVWIPALHFTDKLFNYSESRFPHLQQRDDNLQEHLEQSQCFLKGGSGEKTSVKQVWQERKQVTRKEKTVV